jgi:glycosyltransferase involved in cell wall biosynthesis
VRVAVLTTSYPRSPDDYAGRFVASAVERLRDRGVEVDVVAPGVYRDFGLTSSGGGLVRELRRRPWLAPPLLAAMVTTLRRRARGADLVHAHWLAGAVVASFAGRPFVVTLHGTPSAGRLDDFNVAARLPALLRLVLARARAVICVSEPLGDAVRAAGMRDVVVIPNGIELPAEVGHEASPPEILFAGRLAPEKGIHELMAAAEGLNLVVAGDGPLRPLVPAALGFLSPNELSRRYSRAAIVVCPSRSEGFGVVCAEAMAHGRPVVASAVGGLRELVVDGETGLLVPPRDAGALRAAIDRLLADRELRRRFGEAGRTRIAERYSWNRVIDGTLAVYERAVRN